MSHVRGMLGLGVLLVGAGFVVALLRGRMGKQAANPPAAASAWLASFWPVFEAARAQFSHLKADLALDQEHHVVAWVVGPQHGLQVLAYQCCIVGLDVELGEFLRVREARRG